MPMDWIIDQTDMTSETDQRKVSSMVPHAVLNVRVLDFVSPVRRKVSIMFSLSS